MTSIYTIDAPNCTTVPRISTSNETPILLRLARTLLLSASTYGKQLKRRRKFIALLNYDDHMIDDMGLSRATIEAASRLPLKVNAALIARVWAKQK